MKQFLILGLMLLGSVANAMTVEIYRKSDWDVEGEYRRFSYGINEKLERAWVNFSYPDADCFDRDCDPYTDTYATVEGMSFDSSTEEVVFERDGKRVVCAETYVKRTWLGGRVRVVKPTGKCTYTSKKLPGYYDDGRYRKPKNQWVLYLNVQ